MALIREHRPVAIWSTFRVITTHVIGHILYAGSGFPWIADLRDPMAQDGHPIDSMSWQAHRRIETLAFANASARVITTPSVARMYSGRCPSRLGAAHLIETDYDEESFSSAEAASAERPPLHPGAAILLHSGIVYPREREARALLQAIGLLARAGKVRPSTLRLRFRSAAHVDEITRLATDAGVAEYIDLLPSTGYPESLQEAQRGDLLLLLQNADCKTQVPAKLYEYLRANRPIICLCDDAGDTPSILRAAGLNILVSLADPSAIAVALTRYVDMVRIGQAASPLPSFVASASRQRRSAEPASLLTQVCA